MRQDLESLAYKFFEDAKSDGLFCKQKGEGNYLSLGLTIHRFYDTMFTADFYLALCTRWGTTWGNIPKDSCERSGIFLDRAERQKFLSEEYTEEGVIDAWWNADDAVGVKNFIEVIKITEERFVNQPTLKRRIRESTDAVTLGRLAEKTMQLVKESQFDVELKFQPRNILKKVPGIWYRTAELVLRKSESILNEKTVKILAEDAWRMNVLNIGN